MRPPLIAAAGDRATHRFLEFFKANIRNPHTRRAYGRAAVDFCCGATAKVCHRSRPSARSTLPHGSNCRHSAARRQR